MADLEYNDLEGNESLLRAVEYLRMLPEWKAKPGKLRTGYAEFAEVIARHLVNIYCQLEGKTLTEKIELSEQLNPLQEDRVQRQPDGQLKQYLEQLNAWHLRLAVVRDVVGHVFDELDPDAPEWMQSTALLAQEQFSDLVESCPFPKV